MNDLRPFDEFQEKVLGLIESGDPVSEDAFGALAAGLHRLQAGAIGPLGSLVQRRGPCDDWRSLPALPAAMFKEFDLTVLGEDERERVFHSSGTTEQRPSRHYHCRRSLALYEASLLRWFRLNVPVADGAVVISLTPGPDAAVNSSLVHMFECVGRRAGGARFAGALNADGGWELDQPLAMGAVEEARVAGKAVLLLGTAFSFVHLLDWMEAESLCVELPAGSRVLETGGYKGRSRVVPKDELYRQIRTRLGVDEAGIVCEYGMSELSSQAYDTGRAVVESGETLRVFRFPPWARARVISPETGEEAAEGEVGLLRILDLANVYSVMAVQTEDLARRRGDGFELIGRPSQAEARGCSLMAVAE